VRFRLGGGLAAVAVVAAALLPVGPVDERPLHLVASGDSGPFVGLFAHPSGVTLSQLDPVTLERLGSSVEVGAVLASSFSPDRRAVALAGRDALRVVTLDDMTPKPQAIALGGQAAALLWADSDRVVALLTRPGAMTAETVDLANGVVRRGPNLGGQPLAIATTRDALVALVAPPNAIAAARLVIIRPGATRTVALARVRAGTVVSRRPGELPSRRAPGLAVDPDADRAYVVDPDGTVAVVDLRRATVSYRTPTRPQSAFRRFAAWLQPAAEAKGFDGPSRTAVWLGDGRLAVVGSDDTIRRVPGRGYVATSQPAGLEIVDTRTWTARTVDPGASSVDVADGLLIATGSSWTSETNRPKGIGLVGYGPVLTPELHLYDRRAVYVFALIGGRAYVSAGGKQLDVVDLASGSVVARRPFEGMPRLLVPIP
jgi:DNA-binding beta-propeller fold protein YncE